MSYLALYRKYRPTSFDDFVGQDSIVKALKHQIDTKTFTHSYIFSGIRGTGKTSMAKVFAKSLNCITPIEGNACNSCEQCKSFNQGSSIDMIEIDAASNNGVDDVRQIRENARFLPVYSEYKIYIIDEVQMLSQGAFNALLKTLEEPQSKVIFILATTELYKIPDTILSRCIQFNFKRIEKKDMIARLSYILDKENVKYDNKALEIIVRHSGGALRDAISMLDKTLSYNREKVDEESISEAIGILSVDKIHHIINSVFKSEIDKVLTFIDEFINSGKQVDKIIEETTFFIRMIIVDRILKNENEYLKYYKNIETKELNEFLEDLDKLYRELRFSISTKLSLEILLIKWSKARVNEEVEEVVKEVKEVKEESIEEKWNRFLDILKDEEDISYYAYLCEAKIKSVEDKNIYITYDEENEFYKESIRKKEFRDKVKEILFKTFKEDYDIILYDEKLIVEEYFENFSDRLSME